MYVLYVCLYFSETGLLKVFFTYRFWPLEQVLPEEVRESTGFCKVKGWAYEGHLAASITLNPSALLFFIVVMAAWHRIYLYACLYSLSPQETVSSRRVGIPLFTTAFSALEHSLARDRCTVNISEWMTLVMWPNGKKAFSKVRLEAPELYLTTGTSAWS